jgi:hypothetical protein
MVNDLLDCIRAGGNYLAALGLATYTEICGRQILFKGKSNIPDWKCFNEFIKYMGADEVLNRKIAHKGKQLHFKDVVRNGLVHEYFMKIDHGGVAMISKDIIVKRCGFKIYNANGIDVVVLVVVPYFKLFCKALARAEANNELLWFD